MKLLTQFLNKSFSKLSPNSTVTNNEVANVIKTAAMTQDFLENTTKKLGNKPNADIIFKRIKECDESILKQSFYFVLVFMLKNIKQKLNYREWTLAIDTHYEPFYGDYKDLWVHGYKPKGAKGCKGSYCYITIAIVVGQQQFTLLALPVHLGQDKTELIEQLVLVARKNLRIKLILFDRGFDSGSITRKLNQMGLKYIIFAKRNDKIKRYFEQTDSFSHKYFYDKIEWRENKSIQREKAKYLIIKDYVDLKEWKVYDWVFITNLSNINAISYVYIYKRRWCIENTYKQFNAFRIQTISVNFVVRYFFFLFRVLLYNLWKFYNEIVGVYTKFKEFVFILFLSSLNVDYALACRKKVEEFEDMILSKQDKIMSCLSNLIIFYKYYFY